jgi:hypothetical protein
MGKWLPPINVRHSRSASRQMASLAQSSLAYDRGEQFDEQNRQDGNGQHYWTGTSRAYPNVTMVGSLTRTGDRLVYSETISDTVLGSVQITSTCKPILEWSLM